MDKIFSIQIPVFRAKFLDICVQSVINQTQQLWELIILVDNNTNCELQKINQCLEKYKENQNIKIYYQKNQGIGKTRLKLFKMTSLPYIIPLDDDDMLIDNAVEECYKVVSSKATHDFSMIRAYRIESTYEINILEILKKKCTYIHNSLSKLLNSPAITLQQDYRRTRFGLPIRLNFGQFYCFNRKYLEKIKIHLYPQFFTIGFDIDCLFKLEEKEKVIWLEKILYLKRVHNDNALNLLSKKEQNALVQKYFSNMLKRRKINNKITVETNGKINLYHKYTQAINIELSTFCNANCLFCPKQESKTSQKGFTTFETFKTIIDKAKNYYIDEIYFGGRIDEPFLHPQILDFIKYIKETSGLKLNIMTNASLLTKKIINQLLDLNDSILDLKLMINLPSLDPIIYNKITSLDLKTTANNIKYLIHHKDKIKITIQLVINEINNAKAPVMIKKFQRLGIHVDANFCHNRGGYLNNPQIINNEFYKKHKISFDKKIKICKFSSEVFFISWDGNFLSCSNDWKGNNILGNIYKDNFATIDKKIKNLKTAHNYFSNCAECNIKFLVYSSKAECKVQSG